MERMADGEAEEARQRTLGSCTVRARPCPRAPAGARARFFFVLGPSDDFIIDIRMNKYTYLLFCFVGCLSIFPYVLHAGVNMYTYSCMYTKSIVSVYNL